MQSNSRQRPLFPWSKWVSNSRWVPEFADGRPASRTGPDQGLRSGCCRRLHLLETGVTLPRTGARPDYPACRRSTPTRLQQAWEDRARAHQRQSPRTVQTSVVVILSGAGRRTRRSAAQPPPFPWPRPTITGDGFCLQRSGGCARDSVRVITRYHPVLSVPAATIRGMAGDQETVTVAAGGALVPGPAPGRWGRWRSPPSCSRARAPSCRCWPGWVNGRLLAAAWLASLRAPRTRRAYAGDVRGWLGGWPSASTMCWTRAGCTWTCGRPGSRTRARKRPACGVGCRRCRASTVIRRR